MHGHSIEDRFIGHIDREAEQVRSDRYTGDPKFDRIIDSWEQVKPDFDDFSDVYSEEQIAAQKLRYQEKIAAAQQERKIGVRSKEAIASEYVFMEIFQNLGWGETEHFIVCISPASDFANLCEHTDYYLAIYLKDENGQVNYQKGLYLAIDQTTNESIQALEEKIKGIKNKLRRGNIHETEHFLPDSPEDTNRGKLKLPQIILGANREKIAELRNKITTDPESLKTDPTQIDAWEQIEKQLEWQMHVLKKNKGSFEARRTCQRALEIVSEIKKEKEKELGWHKSSFDPVQERILNSLH